MVERIDEADQTIDSFAGKELRGSQVAALKGFDDWIDSGEQEERLRMGHVILPMGSGKTALGVIFAEKIRAANGKKTLVLSWSNNTGAQFFDGANDHARETGSEIMADTSLSGRKAHVNANFVISNFASIKNWPNLEELGLIIIDEGDVNALSKPRSALLKEIAEKYKIPIVALSATDELASRRRIEEVFPDAIIYMGMPGSLKELLEQGHVPEMDFYDVELNASLEIDGETKEISDEETNRLLRESWNTKLLDFYDGSIRDRSPKPKTAFIYKNNSLLEDLITKATERGLKIAKLTGEEDENDLARISAELESGVLDGVAGSKKLGRGTDIPCIDHVIDSQLTKSPQLFWQGKGRSFRINPNVPDKQCHVYNMLPARIIDNAGKKVDRYQGPLTHASFFVENYYDRDRKSGKGLQDQVTDHFTLRHIARIRSSRDILNLRHEYNKKPPDYLSLPELLAGEISRLQEITQHNIYRIVTRWKEGNKDAESLLDWEDKMTRAEEVEAIKKARNGDKKAAEALLIANRPLIAAIAGVLSDKPQIQQEIAQIGMIKLSHTIQNYKEDGRARLVRMAIKGVILYMGRHQSKYGEALAIDINNGTRDKVYTLAKLNAEGKTRSEKKRKLKVRSTKDYDGDNLFSQFEHTLIGDLEDQIDQRNDLISSSDVEQELLDKEDLELLREGFHAELSERQRYILMKRYGFIDKHINPGGDELSLSAVGKEMGLYRARVETIENEALNRLRSVVSYGIEVDISIPEGEESESETTDWDPMIVGSLKSEIRKDDSGLFSILAGNRWAEGTLRKYIKTLEARETKLINEIKLIENSIKTEDGTGLLALKMELNRTHKIVACMEDILGKTAKPKTSDTPQT